MKLSSPTSQRIASTNRTSLPCTLLIARSENTSASAITNARISLGSAFLSLFLSSGLGASAPATGRRDFESRRLLQLLVEPVVAVHVAPGAAGRAQGEVHLPGEALRLVQ